MPGRILGSLIGATFGLVYVIVNSGSLPSTATWVARGLGAAAFLALVALAVRATRRAEPATPRSERRRARAPLSPHPWRQGERGR